MPRNPPDPALVDLVLESISAGVASAEVARAAGVAEATVRSWVKKYGEGLTIRTIATPEVVAALTPPGPDHPSQDAVPLDEGEFDTLAELRKGHRELMQTARQARAMGNLSASQKAYRDAAGMANTIARVEKSTLNDADVLRVSKHEIGEAMAQHRERVKAILDQPLTCAKCGCELRIDWTKGKRDD